jgi:hypothetical protein
MATKTITPRPRQRFKRIHQECTGFLVMPPSNRTIRLSTADVSREGLKAILWERIYFGSRMMISVVLGEFNVANLVAKPVWANEENQVGFEIEQATPNWLEFVKSLETTA